MVSADVDVQNIHVFISAVRLAQEDVGQRLTADRYTLLLEKDVEKQSQLIWKKAGTRPFCHNDDQLPTVDAKNAPLI